MTDVEDNKRKAYSMTTPRRRECLRCLIKSIEKGGVKVQRRHRFYTDMLFGVCLWEQLGNGAALASPATDRVVLATGPGQGALDRHGHGK